jgi:hypothetical protein
MLKYLDLIRSQLKELFKRVRLPLQYNTRRLGHPAECGYWHIPSFLEAGYDLKLGTDRAGSWDERTHK